MEDALALETRLRRLKRRNRLSAVGLTAAGVLLCCAVASAHWQPPETLDELRVRRLAVVDESGGERVVLRVDRVDDGALSPRLAFLAKDGVEVLALFGRPRRDLASAIEVNNARGRLGQVLFAHPDEFALHWMCNRMGVKVVERGGR